MNTNELNAIEEMLRQDPGVVATTISNYLFVAETVRKSYGGKFEAAAALDRLIAEAKQLQREIANGQALHRV